MQDKDLSHINTRYTGPAAILGAGEAGIALQRHEVAQAPMQLATSIHYDAVQDFKDPNGNPYPNKPVGNHVHARLDAGNQKTGTDTSGSDALCFQGNWVRGHLLNHDLGGVALYNNLFPITTQANSEHYHEVEKHVKHWLGWANNNRDNNNDCTHHIVYDVSASQTGNTPGGTFACDAYTVAEDANDDYAAGPRINKTIVSSPGPVANTREYNYKNNVNQVGRYAQVNMGLANTVLRDQYPRGNAGAPNNWRHVHGTALINNQTIDDLNELDADGKLALFGDAGPILGDDNDEQVDLGDV